MGRVHFYYVIRLSDTSSFTHTNTHTALQGWESCTSNENVYLFKAEICHNQKKTFLCGIGLFWFHFFPGFPAWLISSTYKPCDILALGHLLLYSSSVTTTKTTVGQEPRLPAARNHTGMTTSTAIIQALERTNFHVNCRASVQGVSRFYKVTDLGRTFVSELFSETALLPHGQKTSLATGLFWVCYYYLLLTKCQIKLIVIVLNSCIY